MEEYYFALILRDMKLNKVKEIQRDIHDLIVPLFQEKKYPFIFSGINYSDIFLFKNYASSDDIVNFRINSIVLKDRYTSKHIGPESLDYNYGLVGVLDSYPIEKIVQNFAGGSYDLFFKS